MHGVLVVERRTKRREQVFIIKTDDIANLSDSPSYAEDEDSNSAAFFSSDRLYLFVDCLETVDDLCLGAIDYEFDFGDGQSFRVHHKLLCNLADFTS